MPNPDPSKSPPPCFDPRMTSILLDFDGTLVDIADRPDAVTVDRPLIDLIGRLDRAVDHRLAIVSGRSIAQLDALLGPIASAVTLVGSHGCEMRSGRQTMTISPPRPAALDEARNRFERAFGDRPTMVIETKSFGVAVHFRQDQDMEAAAIALATEFADETGLELQHGKMMVELRTAGHDKGSAIRQLAQQTPFAACAPVFIGDDLTDEPGFSACDALGGYGVLVGPPRETQARFRLDDVAAVRRWLGAS